MLQAQHLSQALAVAANGLQRTLCDSQLEQTQKNHLQGIDQAGQHQNQHQHPGLLAVEAQLS